MSLIVVRNAEPIAIQHEELEHGRRAGPLVAVHISVIAGDRHAETNAQRKDIIDALIMIEVDRSRDRALDQSLILDACQAAEAVNLVVMNFPDIFDRQPERLTFQDRSGYSCNVP